MPLSATPTAETRTERLPVLALIGLFVVGAFVVAHNILYTYIAKFLADEGLGRQTGPILFVFGAASVVSILLVGAHIDRHLRKIIVTCAVVFAVSTLILALFTGTTVLVYLASAAWGLAFGSSATLFTTAIVVASGPAGDVAQSVMISVFSGSIAADGLIGGALLSGFSSHVLVEVCFVLAAAAAIVAYSAKRHAFPLDA
ncbi:hypothetical protein GTZ89_26345 [Streptomyces sp. SID8382]|uniref:MFS transporter n=1 Tax=Streptomyces malaysiensis TaxID=92644 RepID=UPI000C2CB5C8|nr:MULTISPECIES: MFS transporter [unclassified Streptomyces]AUA17260.1 putative arabinose transporter [Streptomyces sp. M56]MYX59089.1 hypothetical protein [Streptomyces sp. SID8382]